jgi:prevent-host-death family protein
MTLKFVWNHALLTLDIALKSANFNPMEIVTYAEIRANPNAVMDRAVNDHTPIAITQRGGKPVVMVGLDDWNFVQSIIGGEPTIIRD